MFKNKINVDVLNKIRVLYFYKLNHWKAVLKDCYNVSLSKKFLLFFYL